MVCYQVVNAVETIIVVRVRCMKNVESKKGDSMRELVLKRMEQELNEYRSCLVSEQLTAKALFQKAYQMTIKQGLHYIFENQNYAKLSTEEWDWLNKQEHILNYLYTLWMHNDADLAEEFAEIIHAEITYDMGVHTNE